MTAQGAGSDHSWFDGDGARRVSDIGLGATLVVVAALTIAHVPGNLFTSWRQDGWQFPAVVATALAVVGLAAIARGSFLGHRPRERWSLGALLAIGALVTGVLAVQAAVISGLAMSVAAMLLPLSGPGVFMAVLEAQQRASQSMLQWVGLGPPDLATLIILTLAAAVALARQSRLRAIGMVLLGLLLSTVGQDALTGGLRLTMGLERLRDGIPVLPLALGLIVVADSAICLASPTLLLRTYAHLVAGWTGIRLSTEAAIVLRIAAALSIAAACTYAFMYAYAAFDLGVLVAFAAFGIACKLLGWNRPALLLAMAYGPELELHVRSSMLLSNGDPAIFGRWPWSGAFLLLACVALAAGALLSLRRDLLPGRSAAQA